MLLSMLQATHSVCGADPDRVVHKRQYAIFSIVLHLVQSFTHVQSGYEHYYIGIALAYTHFTRTPGQQRIWPTIGSRAGIGYLLLKMQPPSQIQHISGYTD
ncbi:hypothetical protein KIL84_004779 [Mauremys mutica]|uniref:Uncharacterized protein n=1 Tax=Mauremys mutica TaxID=74926 RepID=A0A9D3XP68_9SAUR|nr:hypothetical protein KIL84_004779 [Mauremys mutica]